MILEQPLTYIKGGLTKIINKTVRIIVKFYLKYLIFLLYTYHFQERANVLAAAAINDQALFLSDEATNALPQSGDNSFFQSRYNFTRTTRAPTLTATSSIQYAFDCADGAQRQSPRTGVSPLMEQTSTFDDEDEAGTSGCSSSNVAPQKTRGGCTVEDGQGPVMPSTSFLAPRSDQSSGSLSTSSRSRFVIVISSGRWLCEVLDI